MGLWHWLAHGSVLHAVYPTLDLHQAVENRGHAARGEQLVEEAGEAGSE